MKTQQNTTIKLTKNYNHFTQDERNELAILLKKDYSLRDIADVLNRSPSSVSREIERNSVKGRYVPKKAKLKARVRRMQSKYQGMKIRGDQRLAEYIEEKLKKGWSPERISGRLKYKHKVHISHKSIYKYIHNNPFGFSLVKYLKYKGKEWKRKPDSKWGEIIKDRVFIDLRPHVINQKLRYGDFEADTMGRTRDASPQTLVVARERKSRYVLAKKVSRLKYSIDGLKTMFSPLPVRSVTFDNGVENARYKELNVESYFCHPFASWEKGSVENAIGIVREYIPKGSDLINYSDEYISAIIDRINGIPMKCLQFSTPKEVFEQNYLKVKKHKCCT